MVTSSVVNSFNISPEMNNTTKVSDSKNDDKFKELINKDTSDKTDKADDKSTVETDKTEDKKVDKDDSEKTVKDAPNDLVVEEKVILSELAKIMVKVNPVEEVVAPVLNNGKVQGENVEADAINVNLQTNALTDNLTEEQVNVNIAEGNKIENSINPLKGENVSSENGKIELNEGFELVDKQTGEEMVQGFQDLMNQKNDGKEKNTDNLGIGTESNIKNFEFARTNMVQHTNATPIAEPINRSEETINKMVKTFVQEFKQGKHEMEIALEPANLGKLTIKVAYESGKAVVSILCSEKNLDIISKNSAQIAVILQEYTGNDTKIVVENPQMDYLNQENQQQNQQQKEQEYKEKNEQSIDEKETIDFFEQLRLGLVKEV